MFAEIRIERVGALHAAAVVVDDFLKRGEAAVVHVGRGQRDVAQGRGFEFSAVCGVAGDRHPAGVGGFEVEAVVVKQVVGEKRAAVAVETIRATESACGIVLGHEQAEPAFFLFGEFAAFAHRAVELRVL